MFTVALAGKRKLTSTTTWRSKLEALDLIKKNCVNAVNSEEKTNTEYKQRYSKLF